MILRAPRGHTSIYLAEHLKTNWLDFNKFMTAKGFSSFNQYANTTFINDFNNGLSDTINGKTSINKINWNVDTVPIIKDKIKVYTDGEVLDSLKDQQVKINVLIREMTKRGIKI